MTTSKAEWLAPLWTQIYHRCGKAERGRQQT